MLSQPTCALVREGSARHFLTWKDVAAASLVTTLAGLQANIESEDVRQHKEGLIFQWINRIEAVLEFLSKKS